MISEIFNPSSEDYFNSKSTKLQNFINHYKYFQFNSISIISEFSIAKSLIESKNILKPDIYFILKTLSELPSAFKETLKMLTILLTLPVTTATNERFFSSLKRVKSFLRSTTGDEQLRVLMVY